ncbi:MAG TPA: LacI family DNA-binding transcriptional regulator [Armatimonadota bacterium]|jgi:DNA-binding LacI/PurR family transcriptional regulator
MTLREIAQMAGVSVATVSRVVNDVDRHKVSDATRNRILEIARSGRYRPNPQAVSLVTRRPPNTLGLVIPYNSHVFESFYFTEIIRGAVDAAADHGMSIALFVPNRDAPASAYHDTLGKGGALAAAAGVLLIGTRVNDPAIRQCRESKIPFVVVSNSVPDPDVNSVDCDNRSGAQEATRHLLRLGHTRIAFIGGPEGSANARDRLAGYQTALAEAGIFEDPALIAGGQFEEQRGRNAMQRILARGVRPTALFAANDVMALGAMKALKREGLRVPDDVAVVGFDDVPLAQHVEPALTTVHQPIYQLGRRAAEILTAQIISGSTDATRAMLRTRLVIRESCGARRGEA